MFSAIRKFHGAGSKAPSRSNELGAAQYASASAHDVLRALGTRRTGLTENDARERFEHHGPNRLPSIERHRWYELVITNFLHFFALLLLAAAILAWIAGIPELSIAIAGVIAINGLFGFWQEYQAERAVEALEALLPVHVTVRRDGDERQIEAARVVPGDLLVLAEGDLICADARVVSQERLRVDMASLTGESRQVPRTATPISGAPGTAALTNIVFAGTSVTSGRAEAIVYATAADTEFGRIAHLTGVQRERPSPLEHELGRVTRIVTVLAIAMGVACFIAGSGFGGLTVLTSFLFGIGIIVANVPEGLLPTVTLALALGVRRMARRHALVKRLSAVEALGATTVILTDKTGTLTENAMTVRSIWTGGAEYTLTGNGFDRDGALTARKGSASLDEAGFLLRVAALCCDARLTIDPTHPGRFRAFGDPTETALLVAAAKMGLSEERLREWPRIEELPFDSSRKRMTTIHSMDHGRVACVKGAFEYVLERATFLLRDGDVSPLSANDRQNCEEARRRLARAGYRVLAIAMRRLDDAVVPGNSDADVVERDLVFLGLVAMEDPPRRAVPAAIDACRRAGIRVQMITGDDGLTASAIGKEIGLYDERSRVVTGPELDAMTDDALVSFLEDSSLLFARVTPEHKLRLVLAHQRRGEVVAVTGDGVNDAPALKRADVGVAMGETGTEVAREAADVVLVNDDFANIVEAIKHGRGVYDNVQKFVTYIFTHNFPEIVPFVVFVLFGIPLPLTIMQILAVDLGTDLVPALALGAEPAEPDVMNRPPRRREKRLLDLPTLTRAYAWLGLIEATLCLCAYFFSLWLDGWVPGAGVPSMGPAYARATTMSFAGIVSCQIGNLLACRSAKHSAFGESLRANPLIVIGIIVEVTVLLALIHVPWLASFFGLARLDARRWVLLGTFGPVLLLLEELRKLGVGRLSRANRETKRPRP